MLPLLGQWRWVIDGIFILYILKELIHRLERLIVLIEYLQICDCSRGLGASEVNTGEVGKGTSADEKKESERSSERGAELTASIEEQAGAHTLEPTGRGLGLLFTKKDSKPLVEVGRGLGGVPGVEQRHRCLERL